MKIITIVENSPITGIKYGTIEISENKPVKVYECEQEYRRTQQINNKQKCKIYSNKTKSK